MTKLIKVVRAPKQTGKKYTAFFDTKNGIKKVSFGASGYSDYTKHKDDERKKRYIDRHRSKENWNAYMTPGALSRWILWNKKSLSSSIADYKERFGL